MKLSDKARAACEATFDLLLAEVTRGAAVKTLLQQEGVPAERQLYAWLRESDDRRTRWEGALVASGRAPRRSRSADVRSLWPQLIALVENGSDFEAACASVADGPGLTTLKRYKRNNPHLQAELDEAREKFQKSRPPKIKPLPLPPAGQHRAALLRYDLYQRASLAVRNTRDLAEDREDIIADLVVQLLDGQIDVDGMQAAAETAISELYRYRAVSRHSLDRSVFDDGPLHLERLSADLPVHA